MMKRHTGRVEPLAISVQQFCDDYYPCSRAHANNLIKSGAIESFTDGRRRMLVFASAKRYVARKAKSGGAIPPEVSAIKSAAGRKGRAKQLSEAAA